MKTFIVGLCLLLSVGVGWADEEVQATTHTEQVIELYEKIVDNISTNNPAAEVGQLVYLLDSHVSAIGAICESSRDAFSQYEDCMRLYIGSADLGAQSLLLTATHAANQGNKTLAKDLYRSVITTYTGSAYRSYVKKAEFALEDLKGN